MSSIWKNKKIAITGAAGFIGRHMIRFMVDNGAKVTAIVSTSCKKFPAISDRKAVKVYAVDLQNRQDTQRLLKGYHAVFHFAGLDGGSIFKRSHVIDILQINTRIALNVLEACRNNHISRLLLMSSIDVYPSMLTGRIDEKSGNGNWFFEDTTGYAWVKRYSEILAKYYHGNSLRIAIARVGNVYGPGDDIRKGRVIPTFINQAKSGRKIIVRSPKSTKIPFIYVNDLVRALAMLLQVNATGEPVNVLGSQRIDLLSMAKKIVRITDSKSVILYKPSQTTSIMRNYSNNKFLSRTGFKEKFTFDEGIRAMCETL